MSESKETSRVLSRISARELTPDEYAQVAAAGGEIRTTPCSFNPITLTMDGDCPPPL